ncbi:MAG: DJ-1/PfpI family protein [Bacteroidia bacterium]|nr:DJ-1/PfpI family protein [Bacteroidia bacterium]
MEIIIYIYNGMTMLDAIGPYEILRNVEGFNIKFVSKKKGEIKADSHFISIQSKHKISDIEKADILLIPGSTIAFVKEMKDKKLLEWIKKMDEGTQKTVSVCTGSLILAATGLLEGKKASSHWKPIELLSDYGAIPTRERFVEEGKYITAAGVSAGMDMAIHLVNQLRGEKAAKAAQLAIEYDPAPMFKSGNFLKAEEDIIKLAEENMERDAKKDLSFLDKLGNFKTLRKLQK